MRGYVGAGTRRSHALALVVALWCALGSPLRAHADEPAPSEPSDGAAASGLEVSATVFPAIVYTPETSLLFAFGGFWIFKDLEQPPDVLPSSLLVGATYTLRGQILGIAKPELFWEQGRHHALLEIGYEYTPTSFFGVGNEQALAQEEEYAARVARLETLVERRMWRRLSLGVVSETRHERFVELEPDGELAQGGLRGSRGGWISGVGASAAWDARDSAFQPTDGVWARLTASNYAPWLGSDFRFWQAILDARAYWPFWGEQVLAVQGWTHLQGGGVPFQRLATVGGSERLRGVFGGRFRDRRALVAQVEHRWPLWWRFGLVEFIGVGRVWDDWRDLASDGWHPAGGVGLRFLADEPNRVNLRFDVGVAEDEVNFYLNFLEAF
jgi:hypothetical protein